MRLTDIGKLSIKKKVIIVSYYGHDDDMQQNKFIKIFVLL